jgi:CRP-like cAMP-binding protein
LPVDSYVYKEGEESTHLYFVVEGVVELSIANPSKPK